MDNTSINRDLLRAHKVSHPNVPQFKIRQYEPFIRRIRFIHQRRKGQEQSADIGLEVIMTVCLAQPYPQAVTKHSLLFDGLTPRNTIEYPKIIGTQRNAMQPTVAPCSGK